MKFSTTSLSAIVLGIALSQFGIAAASRPEISDERDLSEADVVNTDQYWLPQLNSVGVQCGGTSMRTGDGGAYRCFRDGEGICRDEQLGSFGPGQWTFAIVDSNVTLYTPKNEISWQFCSDVTHVCIGEDHGTEGGQWYSQERPYLFFYNEKTHQYVGELTCDDTDGDDGENLGKPSILKMVELSHTGQYVDYGEDGITVTKFKKGQTEDPDDNNALFEILVKKEGMNSIGDAYYNPFKCFWEQTCTNCGDELYEDFDFEFDFDLATFCAENIPLTEDVKTQIEAALLTFLNQDAECADLAEGITGCVDEVYFDIDIIGFINSNETCGTVDGTSSLLTTRTLWEEEESSLVGGKASPSSTQNELIRGADPALGDDRDVDDRRLQRRNRSRLSRGRAGGRGRCRRCRRRGRNDRKLLEIENLSDSDFEGKPTRSSLQRQAQEVDLKCPPDLAQIFRDQNATLFENVTEADIFNFTYFDADDTVPPECETDINCPSGSSCNEGTCVTRGRPRFTLTWTGNDDLDLHTITPGGFEIYYGNRVDPTTGGNLDIDNVPDEDEFRTWTENIFFPDGPDGNYTVWVNQYYLQGSPDPFTLKIYTDENSSVPIFTYDGSAGLAEDDETTPCVYYEKPSNIVTVSADECVESVVDDGELSTRAGKKDKKKNGGV